MSAGEDLEFKKQLSTNCHGLIDGLETGYGYKPSLAAGIIFCVLFGLSMIVHTVQLTWKRTWWCAVFSLGCLNFYPTINLAPTFFTAGIYVLLGRFIQILGRDSSILSPKMYLWTFCTCDVVSLIIQAVGGAMASAETKKQGGDTAPGTNTMIVGIVFQMFSITVFVGCTADFVHRVFRRRLLQAMSGPITPLFGAMVFSVLVIYIRSIYRTIELSQGWTGYLITREKYFLALDGAMMVAAVVVFNIFHPAWLMPSTKTMGIVSEDSCIYATELR